MNPLLEWHIDMKVPLPGIEVDVFPLHEEPDNLLAPAPGREDQGGLAFPVDRVDLYLFPAEKQLHDPGAQFNRKNLA